MQVANTITKRRAWGYARVSTDAQSERGDSLETQQRAIELVCELEGYSLAGTFIERGVSGSVSFTARPEGSRLLASVGAGDIIVAVKLDRCFRDAHDAAGTLKALKKRSVGLHLRDLGGDVTSSNVSSLVFGLLSNVAEFDRSRIAERIREVKVTQRAKKRFLGGEPPLGFTVEIDPETMHLEKPKKRVVPDEAVQTVARTLRQQGYSARLAAGALTGLGHRATHKAVLKLWSAMGV